MARRQHGAVGSSRTADGDVMTIAANDSPSINAHCSPGPAAPPSSRKLWWKRLQQVRGNSEASTCHPSSPSARGASSQSMPSNSWSRPTWSSIWPRNAATSPPAEATPQRPRSSPATGCQNLGEVLPVRPTTSPKKGDLAQRFVTDEFPPLTSCPSGGLEVSEEFPKAPDVDAEDTGRKCRKWAKFFGELMQAYWSMDMGALLVSGHEASDAEFPSERRKNLRAFFRGRILTGLCAGADGSKGPDILQRCKSEGPGNLANEFAEVISGPAAAAEPGDVESGAAAAAEFADAANPPPSTEVCSPSTDPPALPALVSPPGTGVATDMLLAIVSSGTAATAALPDLTNEPKADRQNDVKMPTVTEERPPGLPKPLHVPQFPQYTLADLAAPELSLGSLMVPDVKLPKPRLKPLSVPSVAGATVWAETPNGCVVELPKDPKKHAERQAKKEEVKKKREINRELCRWSNPSKELIMHAGKPMCPTKAAVPKQRVSQVKKRKTLVAPIEDDAGDDTDADVVAAVRADFANLFHKDEKNYMDDEDATKDPSPSTSPARAAERKQTRTLGRVSTINIEAETVAHPATPHSIRSQSSRKSLGTSHPVSPAKVETKKPELDKCEFRYLCNLARKYNVRLDELKDHRETFRTFDDDDSGEITKAEFNNLISAKCNLPEGQPIPLHLVLPHRRLDIFDSGPIDFEEFLLWNLTFSYTEEVMVPCAAERHVRKIARERQVPLPDVEGIKRTFDSYDTDGSGEIEHDEFSKILCALMNVSNGENGELSDKRLNMYWREVDGDGSGSIEFEEFLTWYLQSFPNLLPGLSRD